MVMLTTVLGAIAILSSWSAIHKREKEYYILLLLLQTGMLGVFMSLDFVLFYVFWEVMLVPMYFLIGVWGSERRLYAAIKFFLYTLAGSVLMLLAILAIYYYREHVRHARNSGASLHGAIRLAAEVAFLGILFRVCDQGADVSVSHVAAGRAHRGSDGRFRHSGRRAAENGDVRFHAIFAADVSRRDGEISRIVIVLSLIGIIYGALVCMMQKDMKKLIAYSSVSHMGFCTLGIFVLTPLGLSGSIIQQINHGISTGALFLLVGVLYERRHTRLISEFGGLSTPMPNFAAVYLIITLSSLGMPLLNGFIGEFTILRGVFEVSWQWAAWGVFGVILGAAYLLWLYQRVMFGSVTNPANEHLPDLNAREYATLIPLVVLAFWIGIYPAPLFRVVEQPVHRLVECVHPGYYSDTHSPGEKAAAAEVGATFPAAATPGATPASGSTGAQAEVK